MDIEFELKRLSLDQVIIGDVQVRDILDHFQKMRDWQANEMVMIANARRHAITDAQTESIELEDEIDELQKEVRDLEELQEKLIDRGNDLAKRGWQIHDNLRNSPLSAETSVVDSLVEYKVSADEWETVVENIEDAD